MDRQIENFIEELRKDIGRWEDEIHFWEDPRIIEMRDIGGSKKTGKEIADGLRRRITDWHALIRRTTMDSSS